MYLPGTIYERIGDLRTSRGWSQKKLSEITGIVTSQISRIETGVIENISSDILIKLARAFGVSADYILGLTTISTPKSYDISELGLSDGAEDVIEAMMKMVGQTTALDEKSAELFKTLAESVLTKPKK